MDKYPIMQFFKYEHLPEKLQAVARVFAKVADTMADELPECAETSAGLRKLLEAKDCFVRAALTKDAVTEFDPCPRCDSPVTIQRCKSEFSRWFGGFEVVCVPCNVVFTGADNRVGAELKAMDLADHL